MLNKANFLKNKKEYIEEIKNGKIFIYPTDTLFGIGSSIYSKESVDKIFELKQRENKPLSIIVPSFEWIEENCIVNEEKLARIKDCLPGAYSFVLELKDKILLYERITNGFGSVSVRIPDSWFTEVIKEAGVPFITTSVNISGEPSAVKISDIPESIISGVDYVVDGEDELSGKGSTIIDLRGEKEVILRK